MFDLRVYTQEDLPDPTILKSVPEFFSEVETQWHEIAPKPPTHLYTHFRNKDFWAARSTVLSPSIIKYETMQKYLLQNHTQNEAEYMSIISQIKELDAPNPWQSFNVEYKFPFPIQNREMPIWICSSKLNDNQFAVITLPRKFNTSKVQGVYVSIELVTNTKNGVKWQMATTSNAQGYIPKFLQDWQIPGIIAEDVNHFLSYVKHR